jgi:hypothetical protein
VTDISTFANEPIHSVQQVYELTSEKTPSHPSQASLASFVHFIHIPKASIPQPIRQLKIICRVVD